MKKQKLTLKQLKADLDDLKNSKSAKLQEVPAANKSKIINFFRQSSMLHLWLITAVLGYARKLPFLSKIVSFLSLWYGKSSWWNILGKIRKAFVVFNALIGILIMFKAVGFSFDNILIGFMAMGHEYFKILGNLTNNIFNWFLNLFDQKIVPNIPNTKSSPGSHGGEKIKSVIDYMTAPTEKIGPVPKDSWNPINTDSLPSISLRDIYMKGSPSIPVDISPWYRDTSTWLWLIGIGCTVGITYLGYKIYTDPSWIYYYLTSPTVTPGSPGPSNIPLPPLPPSPDISLADKTTKSIGGIFTAVGTGLTNSTSFIKNKLNPFSYFSTSTEVNNQFQTFMNYQSDPVTQNRKLYPFTENNPFLPWYKKVKVAMFGEGTFDSFQRIKDQAMADQWYEAITLGKGKYVGGLTPASSSGSLTPTATPNVWTPIGVGVKPTWSTFADNLHTLNIQNKIEGLTPIPKTLAAPIVNMLDAEWQNYNVPKQSIVEASDFVKNWKANSIATSSKVTLEEFPISTNKFNFLKEEILD